MSHRGSDAQLQRPGAWRAVTLLTACLLLFASGGTGAYLVGFARAGGRIAELEQACYRLRDEGQLTRADVERVLTGFASRVITIADIPGEYEMQERTLPPLDSIVQYQKFGARAFIGYSEDGIVELFVPDYD